MGQGNQGLLGGKQETIAYRYLAVSQNVYAQNDGHSQVTFEYILITRDMMRARR